MAKRPRQPEETEAATFGVVPSGPAREVPTMVGPDMTAAPDPADAGTDAGPSDTSATPPPTPSPAGPGPEATGATAEGGLTTPVPGSSPSDFDAGSGESLGVAGRVEPGMTIFDRYLVDSKLGEGGMGTVWLVRHLELDAFRALKLIVSGIAFDPGARARFKREARVMARLQHPNAVVVHDARMGKDAAFIEMEYIRGQSLNKLIRTGVPTPLDWVARILEQLCDVLHEAHDRKIVHRDLKPSNLMLIEGRAPGREVLKVLDFGIAKILEAEGEASGSDFKTNTGAFMGSALWVSPEQAQGIEIDGRSDLYAVGVILYELLTGHRPFGGQITKVIFDHLYSPPPPFASKNPGAAVPAEIERVVMRCLSKKPEERFPTARALYEAFARALPADLKPSARGLVVASSPLDAPSTEVASQGIVPETDPALRGGLPRGELEATLRGAPDAARPETAKAKRRRSLAVVPLAILLGLVAVIGTWAVLTNRSKRPSPELTVKSAVGPVLPPGYRAEPGASPGAPPSAIVRDADGARFVRIDGGPFTMGNDFDKAGVSEDDEDQPSHPVTLSDFYMQENEVTNGEMEAYFIASRVETKDRPSRWKAARDRIEAAGRDPKHYPAVGITHDLADAFARWAGGRLPTEAQWEYAARSRGKPVRFAWGDAPKPNKRLANLDSLGDLGEGMTTMEVRKYPKDRTEQGIYDLMGNVREFCRDVWSEYESSDAPLADPEGPAPPKAGAPSYVIRGGSFATWPNISTTRPRRPDPKDTQDRANIQMAEDQTSDDVGFRVAIELKSPR